MISQGTHGFISFKIKFEVFVKFKEFKALIENQTKKKIKVLRTDNGEEFCGNIPGIMCSITRYNTTPYLTQCNGVVEKMNRMMMEKERSMLNSVEIGQKF